jgi:Glu-tRNA(Gln) amidotransferase subunit E-like FAD-binding protein
MDYTREQLEAMTEEELDEIVHDLKSEEAAEINNRGKEAQIQYILNFL